MGEFWAYSSLVRRQRPPGDAADRRKDGEDAVDSIEDAETVLYSSLDRQAVMDFVDSVEDAETVLYTGHLLHEFDPSEDVTDVPMGDREYEPEDPTTEVPTEPTPGPPTREQPLSTAVWVGLVATLLAIAVILVISL